MPITVTVNTLPTATIAISATSVCQNGTQPIVTLTGAGGTGTYEFIFTDGTSNFSLSSTSTISFSLLTVAPTSYSYSLVSVQDSNG